MPLIHASGQKIWQKVLEPEQSFLLPEKFIL